MRWCRRALEPRLRRRLWLLAAALPLVAIAQAVVDRDEYLSRFDGDGDGRVSLAEYQGYLGRGFRAMDRDGDGVLAGDELPVPTARPRRLEDLLADLAQQFVRLDSDGDGYLDARELTAPPR